jgi:hypothetical protein
VGGAVLGGKIPEPALAAALVAATAAVLLDRVRPARRRPLGVAA